MFFDVAPDASSAPDHGFLATSFSMAKASNQAQSAQHVVERTSVHHQDDDVF